MSRFRPGAPALVLAMCIACLATAFAAEAMAQAPGLVGTWETKLAGQSVTLRFDAGGTGSRDGEAFRYSVQGSRLEIALDEETIALTFEIRGGRLTLSGGDLDEPTTFVRQGAPQAGGEKPGEAGNPARPASPEPAAAAPAVDPAIVGKWRAANGAVIEFKADGTGVNASGGFHYTATGSALFLAESAVLMEYRTEGTRLVVSARGDRATFERAPTGAKVGAPGAAPEEARQVTVNGTRLSTDQIHRFEQQFRVRMLNGSYWYDKACGAWGIQGGAALGFIPANLDLGGPLRADASGNPGTGVFINGRELHLLDVAALQQITTVIPGRYWVDAAGNCGFEGNPTPLVNLVQLAQAARARSGGSYHSRSDLTGIGSGGDGHTSYVMGKDWSVIVGE